MLSTSNILVNMIKNNKSSQWTTSNLNIYYNEGNIAIGTSDISTYKLNVGGSVNATSYLLNGAPFSLQDVSSSNYVLSTSNILVNRILSNVGFTSNYVASTSNILIAKIDINDINSSNYVLSTSNILVNLIKSSSYSQWTTSNTMIYYNGGSVGIGTIDPLAYKLNVAGSINATDYKINGVAMNIGSLSQGMTVQTKHLTYTQMDVKNNIDWDAINDDLTTGFVIAITPSSTSSKILVNMIAHIGTDLAGDARWWGIKLYRKIGTGAWTEVTGANGTETGASAATAGTPVWLSHNLGSLNTASDGIVYSYFIANTTGTYLDAPNTTSIVYYTAYWRQRLGDNPSVSGYLYLNRAAQQNDAFRPAPSSSWTATEIWDLGTPYTPPVGDTSITITSGNVGIGVSPDTNYKLNVGGTISSVIANPVGVVDLLNLRYDANWGLRLQQNYTGAGNIQYNLIHRYNSTDYNSLTFKGANVGINITNPSSKLHINEGTTSIITCYPLRISAGSYANNGNGTATLIGLSTESSGWSKCAIGHCRTGQYDMGSIVFLCNASYDGGNASMSDEKMRIANNGNVAIGTTDTGTYRLNVNGGALIGGDLYVGSSAQAASKIFLGGGAAGDIGYTRSVIESRVYSGTENTELLLFKANDIEGASGPDRIRLRAGTIVFDTYPASLATDDRVTENIRMTIASTGAVSIGGTLSTGATTITGNSVVVGTLEVGSATEELLISGNSIIAQGSNSNISLTLQTKGTSNFTINTGETPAARLTITNTGAVSIPGTLSVGATTITGNSVVLGTLEVGAATAELLISGNSIITQGTDVNIPLTLQTKGTSSFVINTGATPAARFSITNTGNIGIGTNNPQYKCHIRSSYDVIASGLHLDASDGALVDQYTLTMYPYVIGGSMVGWKFRTISQAGGTTTPMTFDNAGNVGIGGNPNSSYKLNVNGIVNATSFVGSGASLTGLTASQIPSLDASKITTGTFTISQIPSLATSNIIGLGTELSTKQATINSTANQIIIGNGNGLTTTSTGLTFVTDTLTATKFSGNGLGITNIPYFNLTNKITVGNGLGITTGTVSTSPNITLELTGGTGITVSTAVNPATITATYTSANLIGIFNTNDFVNNTTTSKIVLSNNTSNYVARINTELNTALSTKQATINSTANQIIIGNGNGLTTTSTGLTFVTDTLTATKFSGNGLGITNIPYFNLTNKITVGNGLGITTGTVSTSPNITLELTGGTGITVSTAVNPATITATYTSANLIGIFNTNDFVNNTTTSKIVLSNNTSNYVRSTSNILVARILSEVGFGSNYILSTSNILVNRINSSTFWAANTVDATKIYYNAGNVGIGTTNPTSRLTISYSSTAVDANAGDVGLLVVNTNNTTGQNSVITNMILPSASKVIYNLGVATGSAWSMYMLGNSSSLRFNPTIGATGTDALVISNTGNLGIGNTAPIGPLCIGNASVASSDGFLVLGKRDAGSTSRQFKIGISDTTFEFAIGNFGVNNVIATWVQQFKIANSAPASSIIVDGTGGLSVFGRIISYYSDERLKTKIANISDPLKIIDKLNGFYYIPNKLAHSLGIINNKQDIGLSAQEVQKVLPELVNIAPFDLEKDKDGNNISKSGDNYLTLAYDRLAPIFVEAIKELNQKNISLTNENVELKKKYNNNNTAINNTTIKIDEYGIIIKSQEERIKDLETKITQILNNMSL